MNEQNSELFGSVRLFPVNIFFSAFSYPFSRLREYVYVPVIEDILEGLP
jgi:hypothetical protein